MATTVRIDNRLFFDDPVRPSNGAKAFLETDNDNNHILISLNESNVASAIKSVFAGVRKNHDGKLGITITVFFSGPVDPNTSIILLTVQQESVTSYGTSIPFIP